jgi:hypothetical protein
MADRPKRTYVAVRIGPKGVEWLDQVAFEETGRDPEAEYTRSHVIRGALIVAKRHEKELRTVMRSRP